jgi:hypothetical protein
MPPERPMEHSKTPLSIALAENARLLEENTRLRKVVDTCGLEPTSNNKPSLQVPALQPQPLRPEEKQKQEQWKIAPFRNLFRGREDAYAMRWEGRDGKSGYMPASIQDWSALLRCDPAERKRVQRKTRKLLALTDEGIRNHDCCWFLTVDFDKASWQEDVEPHDYGFTMVELSSWNIRLAAPVATNFPTGVGWKRIRSPTSVC